MYSRRAETLASYYLKKPGRHLGCIRQPQLAVLPMVLPVALGPEDAAVAGLQ